MPIRAEKQRFTSENVERTPDLPGVYAFYADGEVAFYGAAHGGQTLRRRLSDHLGGNDLPGPDGAKLFSFEVTRFPLSRECALLEEYHRRTWRLPRFNRARQA